MKSKFSEFWKLIPVICILVFVVLVYKPLIIEQKLPIPADTIVGLYHPWRDSFAKDYPQGVPFKNFQITDSVRQQYPWRKLAIDQIKRGELPKWNPYSFAGTPLLGNFQSAVFYPLNSLYFLINKFSTVWAIQVFLQTILGAIFMCLYLRNLKLRSEAVVLGALSWIGCGFFTAWLEWNTVVHVAIWLPLMLLSIDRIIEGKSRLFWPAIYVFSFVSSFFAGYLQPFFYVYILSFAYLIVRIVQTKKWKLILLFLTPQVSLLILVLPQLIPTLKFIGLSARDTDQANWTRPDWFLPWQNLIQLIAPDFFGNPATLNYFGVWNYQEFVSYIGIVPLIFALLALLWRRNKQAIFWGGTLTASLLLALPTPLAKLPFIFNIPFLSTAQPSRIIMLIDFSLAILAAIGLDAYLRSKKTSAVPVIVNLILLILLALLLLYTWQTHASVSFRNLFLPSVLAVSSITLLLAVKLKSDWQKFIVGALLLLTVFDLFRFVQKFEPFSPEEYLYPKTKIMSFLQEKAQKETFRVAALDDRITPPNFSAEYSFQTPSGYDPLYLKRYGEFITALERGRPDVSLPWGFNRIINPKNYTSKLYDLLNIDYLLTFDPLPSSQINGYKLIMQEGRTMLYEKYNIKLGTLPRAFFVIKVTSVTTKKQALDQMFDIDFSPRDYAVIEDSEDLNSQHFGVGNALITSYMPNSIEIKTENSYPGFLVLLDSFHPDWKATIDGLPTKIYITNYTFRGIKVPAGKHTVRFSI